MATNEFSNRLHDAVENYYQYNPDTLMPLLMLALATQGQLKITEKKQKGAYFACSLNIDEIKNYDWVQLNEKLNEKVEDWLKEGVLHLNVEMDLGRSLYPIYQIFLRNDTKDVVQEHHHRMGRLVQHSSNMASEKAQRQYATYILADAMLNTPVEYLKEKYIQIFNHVLDKSDLQPERPRIYVARTLSALLNYDGEGLVYNPFAGCSIAGAMLQSAENYYGDGDSNDKIYAAGLLLNYGMGVSNEHFMQRDSTQWLEGKKIDYVLSTYSGYIQGNTAFDFCLGKCLNDELFTGKYAGMVAPREIFENMTENFKEALNRDWIDTIVVLPFGEIAVLVDVNRENKGVIRLIDCNNPLARRTPIEKILSDEMYATFVPVEDAKLDGCLKSIVAPTLPDREGYHKVRLGDFVSRIPRKVYDLSQIEDEQRVLAYINRHETWYGNRWDENIERRSISNLFGPAYLLDEDCLIVNSAGKAEPRLFNADNGSVFFEDGFAFSLDGFDDPAWIANELKETYVHRQLHPYGNNEMVPESLTEDDYLNLVLYKEGEEEDFNLDDLDMDIEDGEMHDFEMPEEGSDGLEVGYVLTDGKIKYTILNYIAHGAFGYTYRAEMQNCATGAKEIVAVKEYYPTGVLMCGRENNRVIYDEELKEQFLSYKEMFRSEPDFIMSMNDVPDNHVTEIKSIFEHEPTGTIYYVMKYYSGEPLEDMILADQIPTSEQLIIDKIIIPLCKALNAMHTHNILHLDIKPENIVIDENGEAVLIDFGVAQLYDNDGKLLSVRDIHSRSCWSAPENRDGNMKYFGPQADIFGVAATLYTMVSKRNPRPIENPMDRDYVMDAMNCSDEMKAAIAEGMANFANDRPQNAQQFLRNFPGCENIKL